MHQHIFKVGWLLTHNSKTTAIFYYAAFLPGVLLHELSVWLAAGVLNLRATSSLQLPEHDEIGRLKLGFVKLAVHVSPMKRVLVEIIALVAALAILWGIALSIFDLGNALGLASTGGLDEIATALRSLTNKTDFWLWFYLAFTVCNTMLPSFPESLRGRRPIAAALMLLIIVTLVVDNGGELTAELSAATQQVLNNLSLVLILTTIINLVMVLALGSLESVIERVTGHSATFNEGKLITMTRQEARQYRGHSESQRSPAPKAPEPREAKPSVRSIYTLQLPIPGPPGKEPVSKSIAAVLNVPPSQTQAVKPAPETVIRPGPRMKPGAPSKTKEVGKVIRYEPESDRVARENLSAKEADIKASSEGRSPQIPDLKAEDAAAPLEILDPPSKTGERAPFSRPFAKTDIDPVEDENEDTEADEKVRFPRPFALPDVAESDEDDSETTAVAKRSVESRTASAANAASDEKRDEPDVRKLSNGVAGKTKPVPKPSQREQTVANEKLETDDELKYEPIDDAEIYDDDGFYDDDSS